MNNTTHTLFARTTKGRATTIVTGRTYTFNTHNGNFTGEVVTAYTDSTFVVTVGQRVGSHQPTLRLSTDNTRIVTD